MCMEQIHTNPRSSWPVGPIPKKIEPVKLYIAPSCLMWVDRAVNASTFGFTDFQVAFITDFNPACPASACQAVNREQYNVCGSNKSIVQQTINPPFISSTVRWFPPAGASTSGLLSNFPISSRWVSLEVAAFNSLSKSVTFNLTNPMQHLDRERYKQ